MPWRIGYTEHQFAISLCDSSVSNVSVLLERGVGFYFSRELQTSLDELSVFSVVGSITHLFVWSKLVRGL